MRLLSLLLLGMYVSISSFAQDDPDQLPFDVSRPAPVSARLYGKVVNGKTKKGLEAATVQVLINLTDSSGGSVERRVAGTMTRPNGDFRFYNISLPDSFMVRISAIGFAEVVQRASLNRGNDSTTAFERDLGNIVIGEEAALLGAVTVVAQRPPLQLGVDRKIFNVGQSLTSTGGTAIDVMRNIPTVTVDVEGNVQLRGTSPQVFVDGRPTILTLEQIPADDIERVELITNPSSKFDAASTGGIINVVLKKSRRAGMNGVFSAGVGTPGILTGNISLNLRQGKLNFFVSGNYNKSGGVARGESFRQNKVNGIRDDYFNQVSENKRQRRFSSIRFGVDYFIDNRNTITISQNFVKGKFNNDETQTQEYRSKEGILQRTGQRFSNSPSSFNRSNTQLNYKHNFPKSGHELTADITFNTGDRTGNSMMQNFFTPVANGGPQELPDSTVVRNYGTNDNTQVTLQVDYANPLTETSKIEMGARSFINDQTSLFDVFSVIGNTESKLPLSNNYKFAERINAGYVTYTNQLRGVKYQVGLRGEYSTFTGTLIDSARSFGYSLPKDVGSIWDGLFPSLYLTKPINDETEVQLNFSRRIRRPNFWQLNPYIDINDPLNISQGNPQIRPEYVNSIEFNYSQRYTGGSFLGVLYFRNNQGDITRYSDTITTAQFEQLNNAGVDPNAILNTFINAQYTNRMGAEFTVQQKIGESFELIPSINLQYRKVKAVVGKTNLSNEGSNWDTKLIVNYKVPAKTGLFKSLSFQVTVQYESPEIIPQGRNREQYVIDAALRKEFLKNNAATITFSVNDVLNSQRFGQIYDTDYFYQDSYRRWNVRNFRVTFSYRFGKRDLGLFKKEGSERRQNGEERD